MPHKYVIKWHTIANQPQFLWSIVIANDYANHTPQRSLAHCAFQIMITSVSGSTAELRLPKVVLCTHYFAEELHI